MRTHQSTTSQPALQDLGTTSHPNFNAHAETHASRTEGDSSDAGWAMLPHALAGDQRLSAIDVRVVLALLYFARSRNYCTPCDKSIAARAGGINAATVQRSLRRLQELGYISREAVEPSDRNRTGRILHLLWREGHPNQTRPPTQRCPTPRAPLRDKGNVVVEQGKSKTDQDSSLRPRSDQPAQAPTVMSRIDGSILDMTGSPAVPVVSTAMASPAVTPSVLPFDLRAIGRPTPPATAPPCRTGLPVRTPRPNRPRLGLSLEELARVAGETADPILAAELARRTALPPPPEPPPATIPTAALFGLLPGRHDLIMVVARRLCEETNDFKVATQRTFEKMATEVATRATPAATLISCWRQAMGPRAEHKGKVLVAAWRREAAPR